MFKVDLAEQATKLAGNAAHDKVNAGSEAVQQVVGDVTEAGQKVVDDACKTVQDAGEKASQGITGQVTSWGKSSGQSEEKKNAST